MVGEISILLESNEVPNFLGELPQAQVGLVQRHGPQLSAKDPEDPEVRTVLLRVMTSTNERLLKSFAEAISAEAGGAWAAGKGDEPLADDG